MQNIICIIKEFEGIIGAILGSTFTLIITDILKKIGKLKIYLNNFEGRYWYNSKDDRYEQTTSKNMVLVLKVLDLNLILMYIIVVNFQK